MFQKLLKPEVVIYCGQNNNHFYYGMTGEVTHTDSPGEYFLVNWHTQKGKLPRQTHVEDLHFTKDLIVYVK